MPDRLTLVRRAKEGFRRLLPIGTVRRYHRRQALAYIDSLQTEHDPAKKTILAVNHLFDQDLKALARANTEYNFIIIDFAALFKGAWDYFSPDVREIRTPYEGEPQSNRNLYRRHCRLLLDRITAKFPVDLILTANDNFYSIREFIHAARERGVPTVILDKEGTISPHSFEAEAERARRFTPCISDHVYVWSNRQKEYWQKRDVDRSKITVIGQPRSDLFFTEKNSAVDAFFDTPRPLVTLFSYFDTAYIPDDHVRSGLTWTAMKTASHDYFAKLAGDHLEYNFVIKCHPQQLDIDDIRRRYKAPNLRVIGGAEVGNELIQRSELIIAFQTTAVIEAMFMGRKIIYTAWDPHYAELKNDILPFHKASGIVIADTFDRFARACECFFAGDLGDFAFSPDDIVARDRFVNRYLFRPDGHVAERFLEDIGRFMA